MPDNEEYAEIQFAFERPTFLGSDVISFLKNLEMLLNHCAYSVLEPLVTVEQRDFLLRDAVNNDIID